jgi:hypothetical protein
MLQVIALLAAFVLLVLVLQDAFEVMLLPRRVQRKLRLMRLFFRGTWVTWTRLALWFVAGPQRERFLSVYGALSMVLLFALWATGLIVAFGMIEWSLQSGERSGLAEQIYMSGVTFFTLGYGDVVPHSGAARFASVLEAGTGIGFIAIVIGYLPVLYQLFSRREAHVIQLDGRAGSPPTATTMLCRHAEAGGLGKLDELLREWEVWGSELLESHLSYPMLVYYRSQHDNQSWLAALTAVMDTCAAILVGVEDLSPLQARMTFTMARQVVVEMARSFAIAPSRFDGGDRLGPEAYARMEAEFAEAGLGWTAGETSRETLAALRATYEPLLDGMAKHLLLALPGWVADDDATDHWERGHRGLIAARLIEELSDRSSGSALADDSGEVGWRRLRARLKED